MAPFGAINNGTHNNGVATFLYHGIFGRGPQLKPSVFVLVDYRSTADW